MINVAINGFGRIGRTFFRQAIERDNLRIVAVNDLGSMDNIIHLLKYDSVYRLFPYDIKISDGKFLVNGQIILFLQEKDPAKLPWSDLDIDVVVESTGVFDSYEKAKLHLDAGAKRVVISAPVKDKDDPESKIQHILIGANDKEFSSEVLSRVTSDASCTTNAAVPLAAVMKENPGILKAALNTVHGYTASQNLVDGPSKNFRRGRAAAWNIVPSSTGAAIATQKSLPDLKGIFDGVAIRVPVLTGSIVDFTFLAKRKTSVEEINDIFRKAAKEPRWKDILTVTEEPIVSSDIVGNIHASIVDLEFTRVIDGDLVKILSWYDNEWGYSHTLVEHVIRVGMLLPKVKR